MTLDAQRPVGRNAIQLLQVDLSRLHKYGTRRFAEVRHGLPGEKTLTNIWKRSRRMASSTRRSSQKYPNVQYSLTETGVALSDALTVRREPAVR